MSPWSANTQKANDILAKAHREGWSPWSARSEDNQIISTPVRREHVVIRAAKCALECGVVLLGLTAVIGMIYLVAVR